MKTKEQLINRAKESLERVRYLRELRKTYEVNAIYLVVSDVEGNWLENWEVINED